MENKMLISVAQEGELRVAILRGKSLHDLDVEYSGVGQKKANIYKARISKVEPSLEAAFVDYGADKHGFLPLKEVSKLYFTPGFSGDFANLNIKDVLKEGQELIVQIDKEERGTKGAALTTFISLAGSYVVLMPNNPRAGGISRRIDGQDRDELREILRSLHIPEDMGVIVRTAGIGKSTEELQRDLDMLLQHWSVISKASQERAAPFLIYQESDGAIRAVRDHLRQEISEIIVDHVPTYEKVKEYIKLVKSDFSDRINLYSSKVPLFSFYQIERQIESAYQRTLRLPSGGSIVIDYTEALVSIDVNSARATGGSDIEETALNTNLEAANEIARQLRIRDIGGLIVIDFIDMSSIRSQREVSQRLRDVLKYDRARVQVGNISRFGLLEMSRQRLRPHISEAVQITCPRCDGQGTIRSIESLANSIVHLVGEEATKETVGQIQVQVPMDLATFLLNEKRLILNEIEKLQGARILILPNQHLETPKYKIRSLRKNESGGKVDRGSHSYKYIEAVDTLMPEKQITIEKNIEEPAVNTTSIQASSQPTEPYHHSIPAINTATASKQSGQTGRKPKSVIKNIFKAIFGKDTEAGTTTETTATPAQNNNTRSAGTARGNNRRYSSRPRYDNRVKKNRFALAKQGHKKTATPHTQASAIEESSDANAISSTSSVGSTSSTGSSTRPPRYHNRRRPRNGSRRNDSNYRGANNFRGHGGNRSEYANNDTTTPMGDESAHAAAPPGSSNTAPSHVYPARTGFAGAVTTNQNNSANNSAHKPAQQMHEEQGRHKEAEAHRHHNHTQTQPHHQHGNHHDYGQGAENKKVTDTPATPPPPIEPQRAPEKKIGSLIHSSSIHGSDDRDW